MISIDIVRNEEGQIKKLHIEGHAGYDEHGYDIVCAAVSVLSCTAGLALQELAEQKGQFLNESGFLSIQLEEPFMHDGQIILETMVLGLQEIARQYKDFVQIEDSGR